MKKIALFVASLLSMSLWSVAVSHAAGIELATVPARVSAPNDQSAYRRFVLPNGMKVLLLSDPKLNVASASVAVGVGSLADPPQRQGLAHYLEHMLFLGTEKYPSVEEFGEYLQRNGGYNNAYTAPRPHQLPPGGPARRRSTARSTASRSSSSRRCSRPSSTSAKSTRSTPSSRRTSRTTAGASFRCATRSTARAIRRAASTSAAARRSDGTTRDELLAFHDRYYSANRMTLALTGPESLDRLEAWARSYFAPGARPPARRAALPGRLPAAQGRAAHAAHGAGQGPAPHDAEFSAAGPARRCAGSKPAELIGFVLGHEGPGSLLAPSRPRAWPPD